MDLHSSVPAGLFINLTVFFILIVELGCYSPGNCPDLRHL